MHITRLALDHFRSWEQCVVDLQPGVNILSGANGLGKTNIVEAIEVLSTGSSHRATGSLPLVEKGATTATVRVNVEGDSDGGTEGVTTYEATIAAKGSNRARINGGTSRYMRDIVGDIPCVTFMPEDQRLIAGDPASRRTFLNQAGTQLIPEYAEHLQTCTHIAKQRAALLKQLGNRDRADMSSNMTDAALSGLEVWTGQFIDVGVVLTQIRADIIARLNDPFTRIYAQLAGLDQQAGLEYEPSFDEVLLYEQPKPEISKHFQRLYPGEVARGQNLIGPTRDDLTITLNGMPAREFASNGEMWTLALALKMALYELITEDRGMKPIVILDDVFAQLDESRRSQILDFACQQNQVIITVAAIGDIPDTVRENISQNNVAGDMSTKGDLHVTVIDVADLVEKQEKLLHPERLFAALPNTTQSSEVSKSTKLNDNSNSEENKKHFAVNSVSSELVPECVEGAQ